MSSARDNKLLIIMTIDDEIIAHRYVLGGEYFENNLRNAVSSLIIQLKQVVSPRSQPCFKVFRPVTSIKVSGQQLLDYKVEVEIPDEEYI